MHKLRLQNLQKKIEGTMFSIFSWKSSPRTEKAQTKRFRKKRRLCLLPKHLYTDGQAGHMFGAGGGGGGGSTGKSHGEPSPETHNQTAQLIKDYLTQRQLRKRPTALQNGLRPWSGTSPRKTEIKNIPMERYAAEPSEKCTGKPRRVPPI